MKNRTRFSSFACAALLLAGSGCTDDAPTDARASLGGVTVTKYVAIGNSLTAGYQSNALYESAQRYSFPNLLAQQLRSAGAGIGSFEQPIYSDPGNPDPKTGLSARQELISLLGPVIGSRGLTPGSLSNATLPRPYDNLGLPGAPLAGFLDTIGTYQGALAPAIIRSSAGLPKSPFLQLQALSPDLITFWLGANDVLGYAVSGGVSPTAPTPSATFEALYNAAMDALRATAPNAKILVATIPEVSAVPFFTTIGPKIRSNSSLAAFFAGGGVITFQKSGEAGSGTGASALNGAPNDPLITLLAGVATLSLGIPTYAPYRALGAPYDNYAFAQSVGIDSSKPFGMHPQNPIPNAYVLDDGEQAIASAAITAFNNTITTSAAAHNAVVWDCHAFFGEVSATGYQVSGYTFTTSFVVGGMFSLDGVHPSSQGYAIIANEIIGTLNRSFNMNIGTVDVMTIPGIPAPTLAKGGDAYPSFTPASARTLLRLFGSDLF